MDLANPAVEEFNMQLSQTIRLLEAEERLLEKRRRNMLKSTDEERIMDAIKRYG